MGLLELAIAAFVLALIAGGLGFTGVAQGAAGIARFLFGLFLVIALVFVALLIFGINLFAG